MSSPHLPSLASLLGFASALGAFGATPETPHLECPLELPSGRAPTTAGFPPLMEGPIKMYNDVKPCKPLFMKLETAVIGSEGLGRSKWVLSG